MGNSACCHNTSDNKLQIAQISVNPTSFIKIQNFLVAHPIINGILKNRKKQNMIKLLEYSKNRKIKQQDLNDGVYIGDYDSVNMKREGFGVMIELDESYYEGFWSNDVKQGQGVHISNDGSFYEGNWKNNQPDGFGIYEAADLSTKYEGNWQKGIKQGRGIQKYEDGSIYQGQFLHGVKSGSGKLTYANGSEYQGDFFNDDIQGYGIYRGKNSMYEGSWKDGKMHGTGKCEWYNNKKQLVARYVGEYRYGIKQGFGQYTDSKGVTYKAIWTNGQINEKGPVVTENYSQ